MSGDNNNCKTNTPHKKKNRAVVTVKNLDDARKHAINIQTKTAATAITLQLNPLVADNTIPAVIDKKGIRNGQRPKMVAIYLAIIKYK